MTRIHRMAHVLKLNRGRNLLQTDGTRVLQCFTCGQIRTKVAGWKKFVAFLLVGVLLGLTVGALSGCANYPEFPDSSPAILRGETPITGSHCFEGPEVLEK